MFLTGTLSCLCFFLSMLMFLLSFSIHIFVPILSTFSVEFCMNFLLDWNSLFFSFSILLISSSIISFSLTYIPLKNHKMYFLVLYCFIFSMILLTFSNNIFFIMLGWDGLGLSSYILVIFYQNYKSKESGILTILSNRIGDIFIILSISILFSSSSFDLFLSKEFPLMILIFLMLASFSKSAQSPFSAWLPAAMAAPTPISALVHSSTLVTAGVYLMIRTFSDFHPISSFIILIFSSMTLFLSGLSASWEQDLKKIIALSTLSQIAFMMFSIAIFSPFSTFFHLITHALFKSTMFLCAGLLIFSSSYQDMRFHNLFSSYSPSIILSFGICNLALMGLPFLSGFFSKDAILESLLIGPLNILVLFFILFAIGLTANYSVRSSIFSMKLSHLLKTDNLFNSDKFMTFPIIFMTPFSIFLGTSMSWMFFPLQTLIFPNSLKILILVSISLGILVGFNLSFKSKKFNFFGESSISLWFLHFLSCIPPIFLIKNSNWIKFYDKTWVEFSSAQGIFYLLKYLSKYPNFILSSSFMILCLIITLTFMFLMSFS